MRAILSLLLLVPLALGANNPLGNCDKGRAVPYTLAQSGGTCALPSVGIPFAQVNQAFFAGGAKCGACYEVTGPLGTRVVQVVDQCPESTYRCGGDAINFAIDETTFSLIADRTDVDIIYDLGFREVTCEVTGNIQMQAVSAVPATMNTFFSVKFYNNRVPIKEVRVQGSGWNTFNKLTRQGSSATWSWNKASNDLKFPITISLVGETNEIIKTQVSSLSQGAAVDYGTQFADVAGGVGTCPMGASPASVFSDSLGYGWDTSNSFRPVFVNNDDQLNVYSGSACLSAGLYSEGGLQFTRTGGFDPQYFSYLTFAGRADNTANVRVYMGKGESGLSQTVQLTGEWKVFNLSVQSLTESSLETALVFFNGESSQIQIYLDEIKWELNPISPLDGVTQVTSGGIQFNSTTPVVVSDTTSGGSSSDGGDQTGAAATTTAGTTSVIFALLAICIMRFL